MPAATSAKPWKYQVGILGSQEGRRWHLICCEENINTHRSRYALGSHHYSSVRSSLTLLHYPETAYMVGVWFRPRTAQQCFLSLHCNLAIVRTLQPAATEAAILLVAPTSAIASRIVSPRFSTINVTDVYSSREGSSPTHVWQSNPPVNRPTSRVVL